MTPIHPATHRIGRIAALLLATGALLTAATFAETYARWTAPGYAWAAHVLALGHPWEIVSVEVQPGESTPGIVLALTANVRRAATDLLPSADSRTQLHVGEVVAGPLIFWTVLLLWPATSWRQRLLRCLVGVPIFLGLESATTAVQLIHALPEVSAEFAGDSDPLTLYERWSRFLEAGGKFVVEACGVLVTISIEAALRGRAVAPSGVATRPARAGLRP